MMTLNNRTSRTAIAVLALGLPVAGLAAPTDPSAAAPAAPAREAAAPAYEAVAAAPAGQLELGAPDLPETRTVATLAPGLTRTSITRGTPDPNLTWTAEVAIPSASSGAPASVLSMRRVPVQPPKSSRQQASERAWSPCSHPS